MAFCVASAAQTSALRQAVPAAGPLHKQFAAPSRRTQRLAFSPSFDAFTAPESRQQPLFVRPDCPPDAAEERRVAKSAKAASKEKLDAGFTAKPPQFRSALEQVSWMTNIKLREEDVKAHTGKPSNFKLGVFGL